jgi:hypothetical protein
VNNLWIFCADIGSVKNNRFAWFGVDPDGKPIPGASIEILVDVISDKIVHGAKVALGFECPLYVPIRDEPIRLTEARKGEGNRSWSAGAGCNALATGLVEVVWILRKVRTNVLQDVKAFLNWGAFARSTHGLFIWEAFVSGEAKGDRHAHDAEIAVGKFWEALQNPENKNAITEISVFSLVGASIIRAGWSTDVHHLFEPCLVIKA